MNNQDDKLIDRFYRGELNDAELADFHSRMAYDEAFWEAVHLHADALNAIRLEGQALLRKRLTAKGRELDKQSSREPWRWLLVLAIIAVLWLAGRFLTQSDTTAEQPRQQAPIPSSYPTPLLDTDSIIVLMKPPTERVPPQKNTRALFAAWFEPYRDESLEITTRGQKAIQSASDHFQHLYWKGEYKNALLAYDAMGITARENPNLLFLKANCLLATGQGQKATPLLKTIVDEGQSRFVAEAHWYLALSYLSVNEMEEARALLQKIAFDPHASRQKSAKILLKSL